MSSLKHEVEAKQKQALLDKEQLDDLDVIISPVCCLFIHCKDSMVFTLVVACVSIFSTCSNINVGADPIW